MALQIEMCLCKAVWHWVSRPLHIIKHFNLYQQRFVLGIARVILQIVLCREGPHLYVRHSTEMSLLGSWVGLGIRVFSPHWSSGTLVYKHSSAGGVSGLRC